MFEEFTPLIKHRSAYSRPSQKEIQMGNKLHFQLHVTVMKTSTADRKLTKKMQLTLALWEAVSLKSHYLMNASIGLLIRMSMQKSQYNCFKIEAQMSQWLICSCHGRQKVTKCNVLLNPIPDSSCFKSVLEVCLNTNPITPISHLSFSCSAPPMSSSSCITSHKQ